LVDYIARSAFERVPFASSVDFLNPDKRISNRWQREMVRIHVMKEAEQRLFRACSEIVNPFRVSHSSDTTILFD
jgi:hypothetical protein